MSQMNISTPELTEANVVSNLSANADNVAAARAEQVHEYLRGIIKDDMPGAAVTVIQKGKVLFENCYGRPHLDRPDRFDRHTMFDLASVSKQFTAMAIIMLRDKLGETPKSFRYNDPIRAHLSLGHQLPGWLGKIKISQLLNHTSGLPDYDGIFEASKPEDLRRVFNSSAEEGIRIEAVIPRSARADREYGIIEPTPQQVLELLSLLKRNKSKKIPRFDPGTQWEYSNVGYMVLAMLVEQLSGQKFSDFMKEHLFDPLEMSSTFIYTKTEDQRDPEVPNRATSYDRGWTEYHDIDYTPLNYIYGDGNVNTNLEDMFKWDRAIEVMLHPELHPEQQPLVSAAAIKEAFQSRRTQQTTDTQDIKYNFGWFIGNARGLRLMWHQGGWVGFRTIIMRFPHENQRLTIIMLGNNRHLKTGAAACRIAQIYLGAEMREPNVLPMSVEELRSIVKSRRQKLWENTREDLTLEGDSLFVKTPDLEKYRLTPIRKDLFYIAGYEGFDNFSYYFGDDKLAPQAGIRGAQNRCAFIQKR